MIKKYKLNFEFIKNRVSELDLKLSWIADSIRVDRKTVHRWIHGKVKGIQAPHAVALAKLLDCEVDEITISAEKNEFATIHDQRVAATHLITSSLVDKLGPVGEWDVIEMILKSSLVPNLKITTILEIYNQLTIASWRQDKFDQAKIYNKKLEDLSIRANNSQYLVSAYLNSANFLCWNGLINQAVEKYQSCIHLCDKSDTLLLGKIHSNLGATLYECGNFEEGEIHQKKALELFEVHGKAMNKSIAWIHLAIIYLHKNELSQAEYSCSISRDFSLVDDYKYGLEMCKLVTSEILARRGDEELSIEILDSSLNGFRKLEMVSEVIYEFAGRICRILKKMEKSHEYLIKGLDLAKGFPVYQAIIYYELAQTLVLLPDRQDEALAAAKKSKKLLKKFSVINKLDQVQNLINSINYSSKSPN